MWGRGEGGKIMDHVSLPQSSNKCTMVHNQGVNSNCGIKWFVWKLLPSPTLHSIDLNYDFPETLSNSFSLEKLFQLREKNFSVLDENSIKILGKENFVNFKLFSALCPIFNEAWRKTCSRTRNCNKNLLFLNHARKESEMNFCSSKWVKFPAPAVKRTI